MLVTIILAAIIMALVFAMIAIRIILIKNGEFRGTCSTNNPLLKAKGVECEICHGDDDKCASYNENK
jgi:hypothetical protein